MVHRAKIVTSGLYFFYMRFSFGTSPFKGALKGGCSGLSKRSDLETSIQQIGRCGSTTGGTKSDNSERTVTIREWRVQNEKRPLEKEDRRKEREGFLFSILGRSGSFLQRARLHN